MKTLTVRLHGQATASVLLAAVLATSSTLPGLRAQTAAPATAVATDADSAKLSDSDLDELLGPIALYPDALIGIILPASTVPSDITMAARYLEQNGDDANVDDQPWDDSVKALARYPDVLKWMDQNLEWTNSLGEAFVEQPADVMNAVQRLRGEAKTTGNLVNTPQQTVVVEKETIRIVPTDPEVIYVPQYDPEVVYVQTYQPDYTPLITFGAGFVAGAWLSYDFNWGRREFYYGRGCGWNNRDRWYGDRGYRDGSVNVNTNTTNITNITNNNTTINRWQPSANAQRTFTQRQRKNLGNSRIARAERQNIRNGNGKPVKGQVKSVVPRPGKMNAGKGNAANRPKNQPAKRPENQPAANATNRNNGKNNGRNDQKPGNAPNRAENRKNHPKAPTKAPSVAGELPRKNDRSPGSANKPKSPNASAPNRANNGPKKSPNASGSQGDRPNKPKNKPSAAPNAGGGNNHPNRVKKPSSSPNQGSNQVSRPKKSPEASAPRKAPESRPQAAPPQQRRPSSDRPKNQPQSQSVNRPKPQQSKPQARPQQSAPKRSPGAKPGNSGGGERKSEGKKKKKDD